MSELVSGKAGDTGKWSEVVPGAYAGAAGSSVKVSVPVLGTPLGRDPATGDPGKRVAVIEG